MSGWALECLTEGLGPDAQVNILMNEIICGKGELDMHWVFWKTAVLTTYDLLLPLLRGVGDPLLDQVICRHDPFKDRWHLILSWLNSLCQLL